MNGPKHLRSTDPVFPITLAEPFLPVHLLYQEISEPVLHADSAGLSLLSREVARKI
jgi:hypothetical protein